MENEGKLNNLQKENWNWTHNITIQCKTKIKLFRKKEPTPIVRFDQPCTQTSSEPVTYASC